MSLDQYDFTEVIATENINKLFEKSVSAKMPFMVFKTPEGKIDLAHSDDQRNFIIKPWQQASFSLNSFKSTKEFPLPTETSKEDYTVAFNRYQEAFRSRNLQKGILSCVIRQEKPQSFDPIEFFIGLCEAYPSAFSYLLYHPEVGIWCGASPEVLLEGKGEEFSTVALAGTQSANSSHHYQWGAKEREEQELVSQHIREVLEQIEAQKIEESKPETVQAGEVVHLKTDFRFTYRKKIKPLLDQLHPTPAVAGLPVKDSISLIEEVENHRRSLYTGYIGILSEEESRVFVNLRCMQIGKKELALYVGGGITAKSDLESEWQETRLKAKTLLNLLKSTT
ncbi:MAG: isochorismate synthase [Cryomorphaceae bacterium]